MKKIAILGSGSFLARNFITYSLAHNLDYDFQLYDHCDNYEWEKYHFCKIDFGDLDDVKKIDFSVDVIMIFIGKTGTTEGFKDYKNFINVNEIMLLNILHEYIASESRARIIYPSSRLIFKSNEMNAIDEVGKRECKSIYAITKIAAEGYLKIYNNVFGVNYVILRICTPIGTLLDDNGNYGTFSIFKKQAIEKHMITIFGNGLQKKTFTAIIDVCKAFSLLVEKDNLNFNDYNLGGQALSLLEIAKSIAAEYGVPITHVPWEVIYQKVDGGSVVFDSSRFDDEFEMSYMDLFDNDSGSMRS